MFTVTLDMTEFHANKRRTILGLGATVHTAVRRAAFEARDEAKRVGRFKDRTGDLRRSIRVSYSLTGTGAEAIVETPIKYASYVEEGTAPHKILPLNYGVRSGRPVSRITGKRVSVQAGAGRGHALRFYVGGRVVFAAVVNHPGSKPYPFMGPAYLKAEAVLYREVERGFVTIGRLWDEAA